MSDVFATNVACVIGHCNIVFRCGIQEMIHRNCGAPRLIDVDRRRRAGRNTQEMAMANIGEPMRRHHVIPLGHPIPATTEPNPSSLPATKPETQPLESPELEPAK
jgi:hypothetical protein